MTPNPTKSKSTSETRPTRMIEIGFQPWLATRFPNQVVFIDTRFKVDNWRTYTESKVPLHRKLMRLAGNAITVVKIARRQDYDAVVVRAIGTENSNGSLLKLLVRRFLAYGLEAITLYATRGNRVTLAVLDLSDHQTISRRDKRLLQHCRLFFKRELSANIWNTLEAVLPRGYCIGAAFNIPLIAQFPFRLRSISLGIDTATAIAPRNDDKQFDVFYIGTNYGIPARISVEKALVEAESLGLRVFNPKNRLSSTEFRHAIRQSWLCLSPGGMGWDCYRHYEIGLEGSIPIMNTPTILPHRPFLHGVSCFYFRHDEDIPNVLVQALKNKDQLKMMATKAYEHVVSNHSFSALADYIVNEIESVKPTMSERGS